MNSNQMLVKKHRITLQTDLNLSSGNELRIWLPFPD